MRWLSLAILAYALLLLQTTVGSLLTFRAGALGPVGPDLLALVATFVALNVRSGLDAMLAAWMLGLGLDLMTGAGPSVSSVTGPMPLAYALAGGLVYQVREAFFRERLVTQALLAAGFCLAAHAMWLVLQWLLCARAAGVGLGRPLLAAVAVAAYTGALMPGASFVLKRMRRMLIVAPPPAGPGRR